MTDNDFQPTDGSSGNSDGVGPVVDESGAPITHDGDPQWFKQRLGKMARKRDEAIKENDDLRERLARIEGQMQERMNAPAPQQQEAPKPKAKGFAGMEDPREIEGIITEIEGLRTLSVDPDVTAEQRAEAKAQLAKAGNVGELLAQGYRRLAQLDAQGVVDTRWQDFEQRQGASDAVNTLTRELMVEYGPQALQKNSDLRKGVNDLLGEWIGSGMSQQAANDPWTIKKAYAEVSERLGANRGGRGSDPRHSAVEGGGGTRGPSPDDAIAALKKRAESGDYQAGRKAERSKFDQWIGKLRDAGQFG